MTDTELGNFIKDNMLQIINNDILLMNIIKKIIPHDKLIKELMIFELLNSDPTNKINDMLELIKTMQTELFKYNKLTEDIGFEDYIWLNCNKTTRFKLKNNQMAIFNTIPSYLYDDDKVEWFMEKFTDHIQKYISDDSINVDYKIINDEINGVGWVLFICNKN